MANITVSSEIHEFLQAADAAAARSALSLGDSAIKNVGTGATQVASGNHTHAQLHDAATVAGNGITITGQNISLNIGTGAAQVAAGDHTHAQLHDAATVSGNGISIVGQQISLDIGTGAAQVAAGDHDHSGVYQPLDSQLTDIAGLSYASNSLKVVRVNAGETAFELATAGGGLTDFTETLHTSSPNNTVNAAQLEVTGGTTNVDLVLTPKGNGAFILGPEPDGTSTGGNKRGTNAADLGPPVSAATHVASGSRSLRGPAALAASGTNAVALLGTAAGSNSLSFGGTANANSSAAFLGGTTNSGSPLFSMAGGRSCVNSSGANSLQVTFGDHLINSSMSATLFGGFLTSSRYGEFAIGGHDQVRRKTGFTINQFHGTTTTATLQEIFLAGSANLWLTIGSGTINTTIFIIHGVKSDGSAKCRFLRLAGIANVSGTTSLIGSVETIGTDVAASTTIDITANDTNDAYKMETASPGSETWYWHVVALNSAHSFA